MLCFICLFEVLCIYFPNIILFLVQFEVMKKIIHQPLTISVSTYSCSYGPSGKPYYGQYKPLASAVENEKAVTLVCVGLLTK